MKGLPLTSIARTGRKETRDAMKLSSALAFFLVATCTRFTAAAAEHELELFDPKDTTYDGQRQLQTEEVEGDDQIIFNLKMYWEEGYNWQGENERK